MGPGPVDSPEEATMEQTERTQEIGAEHLPDEGLTVPVTSEDHMLGPVDAAVTLVEYAEFECPDCGRAYFKLLALRDRLDQLDTRFIFRHLARDEVHPYSVRAALTAEAAGRQGRFWQMHDRLFSHQHSLQIEDLGHHALAVGLDPDRFNQDVRDPRLLEVVNRHRDGAIQSGVTSTPTLFLNGRHYVGELQVDALMDALTAEADRVRTRDPRGTVR